MELWGDSQRVARGRIEGKMDVERGEWFRFIDMGRVLFVRKKCGHRQAGSASRRMREKEMKIKEGRKRRGNNNPSRDCWPPAPAARPAPRRATGRAERAGADKKRLWVG